MHVVLITILSFLVNLRVDVYTTRNKRCFLDKDSSRGLIYLFILSSHYHLLCPSIALLVDSSKDDYVCVTIPDYDCDILNSVIESYYDLT